ncbi:MAG: hypothetical protein AB8F26_01320, partial [Phycisphaerales bacterium]
MNYTRARTMALRTLKSTLASFLLLGATASCLTAANPAPADDGYVTVRMPGGRTIQVKESVVEGRASRPAWQNRNRSGSGKNPSSSNGPLSAPGAGGSGSGDTGGGSDAADAYPANASKPIRVFAWERSMPEPFENMTKTLIADPRAGSPEAVANWMVARIQSERPEHIAIRLWKELTPAIRDPFDVSDPVELFEAGGFTEGLPEYWTAFAEQLKARGYTPDYIVQDLEEGVGFWYIEEENREAHFSQLFGAQQELVGHVPDRMFQTDLENFTDYRSSEGRIPRRWYELVSYNLRRDIIRRSFQQPFNDVFGQEIPISNYKDLLPTFDVYWYTGNAPHLPVSVSGISAPESYLYDRGRTGRFSGTSKHPRWNMLIDVLNRVRSCAPSGPVHPWIAPPGYGRGMGSNAWARETHLPAEQRLWETKVTHML